MESFSKDTDGFFARHFDRKISGAISRLLLHTPITPNQITLFVTALGIGAGLWMAQPGTGAKIGGSLVFLLTSILDGCDGEVARAKHLTSRLGGWLDLWGDNVVHVAVFYGLGAGLSKDLGTSLYCHLGIAAVIGTIISASLASYQMARRGRSSFVSVLGDTPPVIQSRWKAMMTRIADALARRDFVYAVVVLSFFGWLRWFMWATAIGSNIYAIVLIVLALVPAA